MAYCCDVERKKLQNRISRIHGQVHSLKNKFNDEKFNLENIKKGTSSEAEVQIDNLLEIIKVYGK